MNDAGSHHWDGISVSIITVATILTVGMFGLLGFSGLDESTPDSVLWLLYLTVIGALLSYMVCVGNALIATFELTTSWSSKLGHYQQMALWFFILVVCTVGTACVIATGRLVGFHG